MNLRSLFVAAAFVASFAGAQMTLLTTMAGGNGQNGCMFDIVALNTVTITSFDINMSTSPQTIFIYTHTGTMVGTETNAAAWTLVGTTAAPITGTAGTPTPVPIPVNVTINAGTTQAFYVTNNSGTMAYTNGTAVGAVYAQDANIQFLQGYGKSYPFGGTFQPRVWNGVIHYTPGNTTPYYQTNNNGSSLDINGVQGTAYTTASVSPCINAGFTANLNSLNGVGLGWDVLLSPIAFVPSNQGALMTTGGQIVNVNLAAFAFFLGGSFTTPFFPFSLPASYSITADIYMQMVNIDPTNPDFVALSQPVELHVINSGIPSVPTTDDSSTTVALSGPPFCGPGAIPFFGTNFTQMQIISNGRVMFGTASTSFSPSVATSLTDSGWIGAHTDLNPGAAGSGQITVTQPAPGLVRVDYNGVYYYGTTTPCTMGLQFDVALGVLTIDNFNPNGSASNTMLGLSAGTPLCTDLGPTTFGVGVLTPAPAGYGMIYSLGTANTLMPTGMTRIDFLPNLTATYDWIGS